VKEMKYISQHSCDKTVDDKMAVLFDKIMASKVTYMGFGEAITPLDPPVWVCCFFPDLRLHIKGSMAVSFVFKF